MTRLIDIRRHVEWVHPVRSRLIAMTAWLTHREWVRLPRLRPWSGFCGSFLATFPGPERRPRGLEGMSEWIL
jgi:hypothetical protein